MSEPLYTTYGDFWLFYLREHSKPLTRALHYFGTSLGLLCVIFALVTVQPIWILGLPLFGYFFAWLAHFGVEHNRPATFTYPGWSLLSDFRMFFLFLAGRLTPELRRAGVSTAVK